MSVDTTTDAADAEPAEDYTAGQREVLEVLADGPASGPAIADAIGTTASAVRGRIHRMDGVVRREDQYHLVDDTVVERAAESRREKTTAETVPAVETPECPPPREGRMSVAAKSVVTRQATEQLAEIEAESARLIERAREEGGLAPRPRGLSSEDAPAVDVLVPRGDDHFGETAEAYDRELGDPYEVFNSDIAAEWINQSTTQVVEMVDRFEDAYEFGTVHFALLGDSVTGEDIHPSQPHEIDIPLRDQIDLAADTYFEQVVRLADVFEHVHVPTCPGNHGEIRSRTPAPSSNADDFVYDRLEAMVRVSDLDNVSFTRSWRTAFVNFEVRGWRVHARHGQDSLSHIGTSSGKNKWRGWLDGNDFDIGLRQHYHSKTREPVRGRPVLQSGSISVPDDYAESLAEWSPAGGMVYLIGDEKRLVSAHDIEYSDPSP